MDLVFYTSFEHIGKYGLVNLCYASNGGAIIMLSLLYDCKIVVSIAILNKKREGKEKENRRDEKII